MDLKDKNALLDWLGFAHHRVLKAMMAVRNEDRVSAGEQVARAKEYLDKVTSEMNKMPAKKPV
jgi:hypothetical protein